MKHIRNYTSFIAISLSFIILAVLFHPTLSSLLLPWKRETMLDSFITKMQKNDAVDAQEFWQFREFYYPGALMVNKEGLSTQPLNIISLPKDSLYFTSFRSRYIQSDEFLVSADTLGTILNKKYNKSFLLTQEKNRVILVFIKPVKEMVRANGFYDYKDKDKKLLEGKSWLVVITINK